jgi:acetolactate synthase-1/2/3 large subunit
MGKGAISAKEKTSLGTLGLGFKDYIMEAFMEADLILSIGYDIAEFDPSKWNIGCQKKIIHLDFETAEIYNEYVPDIELVGDLANGLESLSAMMDDPEKKDWYIPVKERIIDSINSYALSDDSTTFTAPAIIHATRSILADHGLLISDVGSHKMWIARNFQTCVPNGCIISNGLASMGISLPGGIAAKMADRNRQVVCMMGDGGSLMNIQELETAVRLKIGYTIIVLNDNNYGLIEWKQQRSAGKSFGTHISNPNFAALAKSFGLAGYKPESMLEFKNTLQHTLSSNEMALIEVPIQTDVNEELITELAEYFENN